MTESVSDPGPILLTGATGYVGGHLLQALERQGYAVRCLARRPEHLKRQVSERTEIVKGDVLDQHTLEQAMHGVRVAYYLIHSMGAAGSFEENDRQAARNFGAAAKAAGVERIIYLGALADQEESLSPHLLSRQEVGQILRSSGVPVLEFRASIVIGTGSISFEMIRALVERLPVMITPRWVSMLAQPIAIDDLLAYLLAALRLPISDYRIYEIGGADQVSYAGIMREYAQSRGLHIKMIPVPVLTPFLSSLWLALVTPLYARIGRRLIESIVHSTVVRDTSALQAFDIRPIGIPEAIRRALAAEDERFNATRFADLLSPPDHRHVSGMRLVDSRTAQVETTPAIAFKPIQQIGGNNGWYAWNWLWRLRGLIDKLVGGVGMTRRRQTAETLQVGDTIDFWRVEKFVPNQLLRLVAEMKLPGRAWLEFEVTGDDSVATIRQTAVFDPFGLSGRLYWYVLYPVHRLVFGGMMRGIVAAALREPLTATVKPVRCLNLYAFSLLDLKLPSDREKETSN